MIRNGTHQAPWVPFDVMAGGRIGRKTVGTMNEVISIARLKVIASGYGVLADAIQLLAEEPENSPARPGIAASVEALRDALAKMPLTQQPQA